METKTKRPRITRKQRAAFFKLCRRVHLYAGLFLVPWVLLYGTTALWFNHPDWLTERDYSSVDAAAFVGSPLEVPVDPDAAAAAVHAALRERLGDTGEGLGSPTHVRIVGRYDLRGQDDAQRIRLRVDGSGRGGSLAKSVVARSPDGPLGNVTELELASSLAPAKDADYSAIADALDLGDMTLTLRRTPSLMFDVDHDGQTWRISYDLIDGEVEAERMADRSSVRTGRSFMLNLHKAHVYPGVWSLRWLWSLIVDTMGVAMIVFGVTGLIMWWQLKKIRRTGTWVLAAAFVSITVLAVSLFSSFGY